jgi:surfeit locus 1 family protein
VLRTALEPRWLALLAVLVAIVVAFAQLGWWQMGRASDADALERVEQRASADAVPLGQVMEPYDPFDDGTSGRAVYARGRYLPELQFLVPERVLQGRQGWWVVVPLRTQDGALLPVLRGWVAQPAAAQAPDTSLRTVTGTLAPSESTTGTDGELDATAGQRSSVDLAALANDWPGELYNAFLFATQERPPATGGEVEPVPPPALGSDGVQWRNVGYGLQWWVFAGFAVYMYLRFLHQATQPRSGHPAQRHTVSP